MALMKTSIDSCKTEGERFVYSFFKGSLSEDFIIWSNIELNVFSGNYNSSTEIDFILFQKDIGLLILSIKDWRINQISKISSKEIIVNNKTQNNQVKRDFKKAGLDLVGNPHELLIGYRNTYEIAYFACQLTNKYKKLIDGKLKNLRNGAIPELIFNRNIQKITEFLNRKINDWLEDRFKLNDIAIIYPNLNRGSDNSKVDDNLFIEIIRYIYEKSKIKFSIHYPNQSITDMFGPEFAEIILSRRDSDDDYSETIQLITSFSSQGSSYKCVIVIMDNFEDQRWKKLRTNLAYITLTRATHNLVLVFSQESDTYKKALDISINMEEESKI